MVWACGAWLGTACSRGSCELRVTRQDVVLFDARTGVGSARAPGWPTSTAPATDSAASTAARHEGGLDREGEPVEPGRRPGDRPGERASPRHASYLARASRRSPTRPSAAHQRLPLLADRPTCNFLFAPAPRARARLDLGGGSGHGYKHGPAVAEHVAEVLTGAAEPEPRFALGSARRRAHCAPPVPSGSRPPGRGHRRACRSRRPAPRDRGWSRAGARSTSRPSSTTRSTCVPQRQRRSQRQPPQAQPASTAVR